MHLMAITRLISLGPQPPRRAAARRRGTAGKVYRIGVLPSSL
jgi:hypothetical protein